MPIVYCAAVHYGTQIHTLHIVQTDRNQQFGRALPDVAHSRVADGQSNLYANGKRP
jgi:hypothetical protein